MNWLLLIISLPTENATVRMRAWRALKASGAAVLRDGVYLMPECEPCRGTLSAVAEDVLSGGGIAHVVRAEEIDGAMFAGLFDRSQDYAGLLAEVTKLREGLPTNSSQDLPKQLRKLRKAFAGLADIDFFPGEARKQVDTAIQDLEREVARMLAPGEPHPVEGVIPRRLLSTYLGRTWATRQRPRVDRLACAWLIRRFIDPQARILWLETPTDCPVDALGFDFDGAAFTHMGGRVTFEVLLASFGLEQPALQRLGALVHHLDVGGVQPPESPGIERVLAGLRASISDDDQLWVAASSLFDGLLVAFEKGALIP